MSNKYLVYSETKGDNWVSRKTVYGDLSHEEATELRDIHVMQNTDPNTFYKIKEQSDEVVAEINL